MMKFGVKDDISSALNAETQSVDEPATELRHNDPITDGNEEFGEKQVIRNQTRTSTNPRYRDYDAAEELSSKGLYTVNTRDHLLNRLETEYPDFKIVLTPEEHPLNWSLRKRLWHTIMFGTTTFTAQFGASMISPNSETIAKQFGVGTEVAIVVFSIYVLGNMVGPMIFAPLSEVAGRKIGVFVPCFIAGVWLCFGATASNIWALMVYRFLAGVFAAAPIVSSGGALGDLWRATERAAALVLYALCIVAGSSSAPTFGALLNTTGSYGWRYTCWLTGLLQMVISVGNLLCLSESFVPVLERQKAKRLRLKTGVWALHADLDAWKLTPEEFLKVHCMRPILMFLTPILSLLVIYTAFVYGLMFICITSVGMEFQKHYHFDYVPSYVPLFAIFVGFFLGGCLNFLNSKRYAKIAAQNGGKASPEDRLPVMMFFGWFMPCGLFLYGWTMRASIHWFVPIVGLGFMGAGICVIFQGSLVYIVDCYTKFAASGIAANTFMRSIFGGVFPLFANQMYNKLGVAWASSLLGFVAVALWPCSWLFYFYGERLREVDPFKDFLH